MKHLWQFVAKNYIDTYSLLIFDSWMKGKTQTLFTNIYSTYAKQGKNLNTWFELNEQQSCKAAPPTTNSLYLDFSLTRVMSGTLRVCWEGVDRYFISTPVNSAGQQKHQGLWWWCYVAIQYGSKAERFDTIFNDPKALSLQQASQIFFVFIFQIWLKSWLNSNFWLHRI